MQKILLLSIVALSSVLFLACEKKKAGYERVMYNIYKGENYLFEFYESSNCYIYNIWNGTLDSNSMVREKYRVDGDSIHLEYFKGVIGEDKLFLKYSTYPEVGEYIKIN